MQQFIERQRFYFQEGHTLSYPFRIKQLKKLKQMIQKNESFIHEALYKDLRKSSYETLTTELSVIYAEIDFTLKHLKKWMQNKRVATPITHIGSKNYIQKDPYGVTLIIAPWNYPVQLAFVPVIGAIAAGNTIVLKPSEHTPNCSKLINKLVQETFSSSFFTVIEGDQSISASLVKMPFDYIFFTGSTHVGKQIMEAASVRLTPVTLELGGKSPCIVSKSANVKLAARRIAWGKFTNAGQTCVAPDYVYVQDSVKKKFIHQLQKEIESMYGKNPLNNSHYVRIVNRNHFQRLKNLIQVKKVIYGGQVHQEQMLIAPTIMDEVTWEDPIMQDEIFGPILPILCYGRIDDLVQTLQNKEKPLALYYFGNNKKEQKYVTKYIPFGGGCINDTLYHLANPHLPFGGIGSSGIGAYHGKYSFDTFTHQKSLLQQTTSFDLPFRYPGSKIKEYVTKKLL